MGPGSGPACDLRLNTTLTDEERRRYQDPAVIRRLLATARTVAIVGMSADPQKASAFVASYLQHEGYRVIPVNPRGGRVLGETIYPDLASIPVPVDIVDVFRPPAEAPGVRAPGGGHRREGALAPASDRELRGRGAGGGGGARRRDGSLRQDGARPVRRHAPLGRDEHRDHQRAESGDAAAALSGDGRARPRPAAGREHAPRGPRR